MNPRKISVNPTVRRLGLLLGLAGCFAAQNSHAALAGYWKLDETSGASSADSSGQNHPATLANGPVWAAGKVANGLDLDGIDDYANIGNIASLNLAGDFTLAAWIRIDGAMSPEGVVARWSLQTGITLRVDSAGRLLYNYANSGGTFQTVYDPGVLRATPGGWHHVALSLERATSKARFYVDGQLSGTSTLAVAPATTSSGTFCLGGLSGSQRFNGAIDEVMLHDRALSAGEIGCLAAAPYPAPAAVAAPSPAPVLQAGMDAYFAPPVGTAAPVAGAPQFAESIHTVATGETLLATGEVFSNYTGDDEGKDTRFLTFGQNATDLGLIDGLVQRLDGRKTAVGLDPLLPANTMYWVWPKNSSGYGRPLAVNRTEAWWVGPAKAKAGTTTSVYGRNLSKAGGTTNAWVYIKPTTASAGQWCSVSSVNPHKVDFVVPAGLANGTYEVWAHNGHGAQYGWSGPLTLTVDAGITWSGPVVSATTYGANGSDGTDDAPQIQAALNAATPYSTVSLPAGTYLTGSTLTMPSNVRLMGAGKTSTIVRGLSSFTGTLVSTSSGRSNQEIRDLTLDTGASAGGTWTRVLLGLSGVTNFRMENVALIAKGSIPDGNNIGATDWLAITPATAVNTNLAFKNCDLTGQLFAVIGTQIFADGLTIRGMNDGNTLDFTGASEVSVTNCTQQDDGPGTYGWAKGRFVVCRNIGKQYAWNHYYADNTVTNAGFRWDVVDEGETKVLNNYGEIFLFEYNEAPFYGMLSSATATTATFGTSVGTAAAPGMAAVIVKGKGLGQVRRITAISGGTVTVSPAWTVTPDSTSRVMLQAALVNTVLYRNHLDGKYDHVTDSRENALNAVLTAGMHQFDMVENVVEEVRNGVRQYNFGESPTHAPAPGFFHLIKGNTFSKTKEALWERYINMEATYTQDDTAISLAHDYRGNTVTDTLNRAFVLHFNVNDASLFPDPPVELVAFQHNAVTNTPKGLGLEGSGVAQRLGSVLLLDNDLTLGTATFSGSYGTYGVIASGYTTSHPKSAFGGNSITGFQTKYMTPLSPVLELPYRTLTLRGKAGGPVQTSSLTIWNSGSASESWSIVSSDAWLTVSSSSGSVADENSSSTVTVTANPATLISAVYNGTLTVTVVTTQGTQTKKVNVQFSVVP